MLESHASSHQGTSVPDLTWTFLGAVEVCDSTLEVDWDPFHFHLRDDVVAPDVEVPGVMATMIGEVDLAGLFLAALTLQAFQKGSRRGE